MSNFPTLDGLNNIEADSGNLTNITCQTFIATTSAQVPTMIAGTNDNNVASTSFVDDAISTAIADLVTTNTIQTITATKFFTNLPECSTLATTGDQFTNKSYVDGAISGAGGSFVTLSGAQTLTSGVKTFTNLPESSATPSTANQLTNKNYLDSNFVALTGTQTVTGNKTTTGNAVFWPTTGTTTIRGTQCDIFADTTFLTGNTTSMSGILAVFNNATSYFGGTLFNMYSTTFVVGNTCNSFYIDASYNNFMGKETYINTPYFAINSGCLNFYNDAITTYLRSSTINMTSACTNFNVNAVNTNMTGTNATCATQISSDNSSKIASTAYVNAHVSSNYMTLATNQNVSGVKTYSTKQIFNAGTASSTYDNTSLTDMSLASNSANGILSIAGGKITTDTFGVRAGIGANLQLNEGTFIQPNTSLAIGKEPVFTFGVDQVENFSATSIEATATKQINTTAFKYWCGNNQSTLFSLTHSLTNGYAIGPGPWEELEIYISWVDANTGITRLTSSNLATTALFSMPSLGTVIRPTITFTLDTLTLPEAVYNINAFVKIKNSFGSNALNTMTWNLSATPSTFTTNQNYNTPKDYTFTSRNLYHCFRNFVAGVFHVNVISAQQNLITPLFYSVTDYANIFTQSSTSGALTVPAVTGGTVEGNWSSLSVNNSENLYILLPNYSIIVYNLTGWSGTIYLNAKNNTNNPIIVAPTTISAGSSCKIYFDEVELLPY